MTAAADADTHTPSFTHCPAEQHQQQAAGGSGAPIGADEQQQRHAAVAALHPVTLALSPPPLEQRFWRDAGTPHYAAIDRWTLLITSANVAAHWRGAWVASFKDNELAPLLLRRLLPYGVLCMVACGLCARLLLAAAPATYMRYRNKIAVLQRMMRTLFQGVGRYY